MREAIHQVFVRYYRAGIAKEEESRVFERFYQTKDNSILISGFGLGLYICKDIMKKHNGRIWIKSNDTGTVFNISLTVNKTAILD